MYNLLDWDNLVSYWSIADVNHTWVALENKMLYLQASRVIQLLGVHLHVYMLNTLEY